MQPSKPVQKRPTFLGTPTSEPPPETSYQAAFSGDTHRHADISVPDITTRTQANIAEMAGKPEVSARPEVSHECGVISGFSMLLILHLIEHICSS